MRVSFGDTLAGCSPKTVTRIVEAQGAHHENAVHGNLLAALGAVYAV